MWGWCSRFQPFFQNLWKVWLTGKQTYLHAGCKNRAAGNWNVFRCSSFSKMLPRCERAAHICEANYFATSSPCCNCTFLKLSNSQFDCLCETSCKFGQGNGAIAARWQAKAEVEPPFAGCGRSVSLEASFPSNKPQATESFSVQQFFKNAAEVWASSPRLRSK